MVKVPLSPGGQKGMCPVATSVSMMLTVKETLDEVLGTREVSAIIAENKTRSLCSYYSSLPPLDKRQFLTTLATDYNVDQSYINHLAQNITALQERGPAVLLRAEDRLRHALIPRYQHLFTQISRLDQGVKFLVDMRTDILTALSISSPDHDNPYLQAMNICMRDLLSLWFSVGFLHLERITWESPCDMLQKISEYEAVHPIRNWSDLKKRVGPYRRCFVFTHNSMPREPVVVLHTALTNEISSSIMSIVQRTGYNQNGDLNGESEQQENPGDVTTAIFYSITSTQRGLQGVELGNYLIKSVVRELQTEFPGMHQFSSLSPIPGFRDWLLGEINRQIHVIDIGEEVEQPVLLPSEQSNLQTVFNCTSQLSMLESLKKVLQSNSWLNNEAQLCTLNLPLMRLCVRYLYMEKRRSYALNPVANFHLRNGATMWRVNWLADTSQRGMTASCGLMVNYRYFLEEVEHNSKAYMEYQRIPASQSVLDLVTLSGHVIEGHIPSPLSSNGSTH